MRTLLLAATLALGACSTWHGGAQYVTSYGSTRYDERSEIDAEREFLTTAVRPPPGSTEAVEARVEAPLVNALRVTPLEPGSAPLAFTLDDHTQVMRGDERVSIATLAPGEVVRVSYERGSESLPAARRIDVLRAP